MGIMVVWLYVFGVIGFYYYYWFGVGGGMCG